MCRSDLECGRFAFGAGFVAGFFVALRGFFCEVVMGIVDVRVVTPEDFDGDSIVFNRDSGKFNVNPTVLGTEVEELFATKDGVDFSVNINFNGFSFADGSSSLKASALGRLKGTDWYVLKFDAAKVDEAAAKFAAERAKRDIAPSDFSGFDVNGIVVEGDTASFTARHNVDKVVLSNLAEFNRHQVPSRLYLFVNEQRIAALYPDIGQKVEGGIAFTPQSSEQQTYSGDEVRIKLVVPGYEELVIAEYTVSFEAANKQENFSKPDNSNLYNNVITATGNDGRVPFTLTVNELPVFKVDLSRYKAATLPWKIESVVGGGVGVMARYVLQVDEQGVAEYVKEVVNSPVTVVDPRTVDLRVYLDKADESRMSYVRMGYYFMNPIIHMDMED